MKTTRGQIKDRAQRPQEGEQRIDRRTVYGNKFIIGDKHPDTGERMTRDDVCDLFEERQLPFMDVEPLRGKRLLCWCKPEDRCHADSIIKKLEQVEHGIGHNSGALEDIATRARLALEQVDAGEKLTMEGWLQYGAALNEGREMFPGDKEFGQWVVHEQLDQADHPDRQAAMWAAANPKEFEAIKEANPRVRTVRGLHAKWKEEQKAAEQERNAKSFVRPEKVHSSYAQQSDVKRPKYRKPTDEEHAKINKLKAKADDPAASQSERQGAFKMLERFRDKGVNLDLILEDIENERRPDVDVEYIAEKMADVVTNSAYDRGWRKAQIQDWLERLFDADDDALMREFDFIMTEKEEPEWQAA